MYFGVGFGLFLGVSMFTGIIARLGTIAAVRPKGKSLCLSVSAGSGFLDDTSLGDSIAVNGVCLTVVQMDKISGRFDADVSAETYALTTLSGLVLGSSVHLEKALRPMDRMGGHIVSGHVDGIGRISSVAQRDGCVDYTVEIPRELAAYISKKGSVAVDGVSLTVNDAWESSFRLTIIPHTTKATNIGSWHVGTEVNIEVDLLARYVERMLGLSKNSESSGHKNTGGITADMLSRCGFM